MPRRPASWTPPILLRLKVERLRRGWTQTDLALRTRLVAQDISKIENGWLIPRPDQLERLAFALEIPLAAVLQRMDVAETAGALR